MGLQIWLPLNGNVNNQGLASNLIFQSLNATVSTSGKIGSCYSFNATNASIDAIHDKSMWRGKPVSYALWFKSDENKASGTILEIGADLCLIYTYDSNLVKFGYWRSYTNTSGSRSGDRLYSQKTYDSSKWHHVAITFNGGTIKLYIDGTLDTSWDRSSLYTDNNPFLLATNYNRITLGRSYGSTSFIGGLANDLRIYDHCLSAEEVKWISQGLTLHYPLSNRGFGGDNLLTNTDFNGVSKKYTLNSGSEGGLWFPPTSWERNTEYTASCRLRGNANMNLYLISSSGNQALLWVNRGDLSTTDYRFFSITFTSRSDRDVSNLYICTRYGTSNSSVGDWFEIAPNSLKFEKGSTATPWMPNSADALYSSLQLNSTTELDCSGYQYNGTRNGTFVNAESPINQGCYVFNGTDSWIRTTANTQHIGIGDFTISAWINLETSSKTYQPIISNKTTAAASVGCAIYFNHSQNKFLWSTADGSGVTEVWTANTFSDIYDKWTHVVMVRNFSDAKKGYFYINGVRQELASVPAIRNISTTHELVIGALYTDSTNYRWTGKISDVRMYATALSENAIKELYMMGGGVV